MNHNTFSLLLIMSACLLNGCASIEKWRMASAEKQRKTQQVTPLYNKADPVNVVSKGEVPGSAHYYASGSRQNTLHMLRAGQYRAQPPIKHVGDYVQNMAQDLISNMDYLTDKTPLAVSNFALLDSDLQKTNLLGKQMAESFMHEMHKFRIPVIEFKATGYIRVSEQGDFFLTRDFLELAENLPIKYVLTGSMVRHHGGYLVNARIVGIQSKAIVASAQRLLPFYVVDSLLPSDASDGIKLIQGD